MKKTLMLFFCWLITPVSVLADQIEPDPDVRLADLLSKLIVIHDTIKFLGPGYSVRFYGLPSYSHCAVALYCRSKTELLVVTTETDDEGPVSTLYRLPEMHEWEVSGWKTLDNGKQSFDLKATVYNTDHPDSDASEEEYDLVTTWSQAELYKRQQQK